MVCNYPLQPPDGIHVSKYKNENNCPINPKYWQDTEQLNLDALEDWQTGHRAGIASTSRMKIICQYVHADIY